MTGLWAFETQMPFQKYQGPPIVVRLVPPNDRAQQGFELATGCAKLGFVCSVLALNQFGEKAAYFGLRTRLLSQRIIGPRKNEWVFTNFPHQNVRFGCWIAIQFTDFVQHLKLKKKCRCFKKYLGHLIEIRDWTKWRFGGKKDGISPIFCIRMLDLVVGLP